MSGQSSGQTLWSPPPSSSSSSSAVPFSVGNEGNRALDVNQIAATSDEQQRDSLPPNDGTNATPQQGNDTHEDLGHRRHRTKHSSGFLLQPKTVPDKRRSYSPSPSGGQARDMKGKRRAEDADLVLPKRRIDPRLHTKLGVGSSPLSRELLSSPRPFNQHAYDEFRGEDILSMPAKAPSGLNMIEGDGAISGAWSAANGNDLRKRSSSALGHDTDPAQIVNLALNLSESRRRNVSTGTAIPTNLGSRRLPSGQHNTSIPYNISPSVGGSLRQYLEQQRYTSRTVSPRSSRFRHRNSSTAYPSRRVESTPQSMVSAVYDSPLSDGTIFDPSAPTLIRAEKARKTLELYYEYRRLLNNLPAIPTPSCNQPALARSGGKFNPENTPGFGRIYNPLQYIRNRKVRARERRSFDADADGWKELDKVRDWVDRVVAEREAGTLSVDNYSPLPVFNVAQARSSPADPSVEPGPKIPGERQTDKLRRPRLNWSFAPWDLLADAYWVQMDNNIRHIEDANGSKIFLEDLDTNGTPPRTSRDLVQSPFRRSQSLTRQNLTPEKPPSFFKHSRHNSTEREHSQHPLNRHKTPISTGVNSRDRKSRWSRHPIRSRDSSSSNDSLNLVAQGHSRDSGHFVVRDHPESAALEKQMREMVKKEAQSIHLNQLAKNKDYGAIHDAQSSLEARKAPLPSDTTTPNEDHLTRRGLKYVQPASKAIGHSASASLDRQQFQPNHRLFYDPSHTATDSPNAHTNVPSIGMDLSSSKNRPTMPNYASNFVMSNQRAGSKERPVIGERYTEAGLAGAKKTPRPEESGANVRNKIDMDRVLNLGNASLLATAADASNAKLQRAESVTQKSPRAPNDQESRLRGFFKGRRIAQLVGDEVHKVGDKLRKKDNLNTLSRVSSVQSGYATDESDLETDLSALESSPEDLLSIVSNRTEGGRLGQNGSNAVARPAYQDRRLPSFRSAFARNEPPPSNSTVFVGADHITRQQNAQRARGRPTRFERLAPPKIDIDRIWPSSSPPTTYSQIRDTDLSRDGSRRSSDSRSDNRVHDVDKRLKAVFGTPGTLGSGKQLVSSVSSLEILHGHVSSQPNAQEQCQRSFSDKSVSALHKAVTKRDLARVEAFLLSSGVKANEISRRGQEVDDLRSAALQSLPENFPGKFSGVPRSQEHMFAARNLIENIEAASQRLQDAEEKFSNTSVDELQSQLQDLDKRLTQKFTPAVRGFADDADALSAELTTTHTLNFKQLNDSIEILMRRRRRRFRWIRRGGYVLLEWTLLGIMWGLWLIVVMVRLVRCTIGLLIGSLRWLFWV